MILAHQASLDRRIVCMGSQSFLEYCPGLEKTYSAGGRNVLAAQSQQPSAFPQSHVVIGQSQQIQSQSGGSTKSKEILALFPDIGRSKDR